MSHPGGRPAKAGGEGFAHWRGARAQPMLCRMSIDSSPVARRTLTEILFILFMRMIAVVCFAFGLEYWAMLSGYAMEGKGRFDLLSFPWQVASAGLSTLFPVAAVGLWLTVSWGPVIWFLAAATQAAMYLVWPEIFGSNLLVVALNAGILLVFVAFRVALTLRKRQAAADVTVDSP